MSNEKILAVDDEPDILELVEYNLAREGFAVATAATGEGALKAVGAGRPDLVVLDLMLPGIDGLEVCRRLKAEPATAGIPIVMLSAKGDDADVVVGLELGADDYVTKPFSPKVLLARVRAVLRRAREAPPGSSEVIKRGDLVIDSARREVRLGRKQVEVTWAEFELLKLLAGRPGRVFTRYQIIDGIRGDDYPVTDRSVDVQVAGLRRKLGGPGDRIETVRGVGYRFTSDPR